MPAIVRKQDQAKRTIADDIRTIGIEVKRARHTHGLSQSAVADAVGCSVQAVHRVEQAMYRGPWSTLSGICKAVGLRLRASVYPEGDAVRDTAQLTLLEDLRARIADSIAWSTEVPLPRPGDPRSWDALLRIDRERIGLDAETRPTDVQEVLRRVGTKKRDGGVDHVILLMRDTRYVRNLLRDHGGLIGASFSVDSDAALAELAAGRSPRRDTIIVLPTRRALTFAARKSGTARAPKATEPTTEASRATEPTTRAPRAMEPTTRVHEHGAAPVRRTRG